MDDLKIHGVDNPTDDEANLLQGLFEQIAEFDKDDVIPAGEWLWSFLNDIRWRYEMVAKQHRSTPRAMEVLEAILRSTDYDMDIEQLRELGAASYAKRHPEPEPRTSSSDCHDEARSTNRARAVDAAFRQRANSGGNVERDRPKSRRRSS